MNGWVKTGCRTNEIATIHEVVKGRCRSSYAL